MKFNISRKRQRKRLNRLRKRERIQRSINQRSSNVSKELASILRDKVNGEITYDGAIDAFMPDGVKELLANVKSNFHRINVLDVNPSHARQTKRFVVLEFPDSFSLVDEPVKAFEFLAKVIKTVLFETHRRVEFSWINCKRLDIGAQVLFDIIMKDMIRFFAECRRHKILRRKFPQINKGIGPAGSDMNSTSINIVKILASVGSLAELGKEAISFDDIIPFKLRVFHRNPKFTAKQVGHQKELDITAIVRYIEDSLDRLGRKLTADKLYSLAVVVGETLDNAEQHSTSHRRYSIGYFQESKTNGVKQGVFRLVILNFGDTIYEKFKSPDYSGIPTMVTNMERLSKKYIKSSFFFPDQFREEELWTLYALQEGVTSIPKVKNLKRGSGSIRFIESFFDLKGYGQLQDDKSRLTIFSGDTNIVFDGTYGFSEQIVDGQAMKLMTFNKSCRIEDPPDRRFVKRMPTYFPGTIISARIELREDDFEK